jgi:hypothetical protein
MCPAIANDVRNSLKQKMHLNFDDFLDEGKKVFSLVGSVELGPVLSMLCTCVATASKLIWSGVADSKFYVSEILVV